MPCHAGKMLLKSASLYLGDDGKLAHPAALSRPNQDMTDKISDLLRSNMPQLWLNHRVLFEARLAVKSSDVQGMATLVPTLFVTLCNQTYYSLGSRQRR